MVESLAIADEDADRRAGTPVTTVVHNVHSLLFVSGLRECRAGDAGDVRQSTNQHKVRAVVARAVGVAAGGARALAGCASAGDSGRRGVERGGIDGGPRRAAEA